MKPQASEKSRKRNSRRMASRPSTGVQRGSPSASPARAVASSRSTIHPSIVLLDAGPGEASGGAMRHTTPPSLDDLLDMAETAFAAIPAPLRDLVRGAAIVVEE